MSSSTKSVSKAGCIRDALHTLGMGASAAQVLEHCKGQGHKHKIAPAQISNVRTSMLAKKGKRGRKGKKVAGEPQYQAGELIQARVMADKVGGVSRAKELLDILNKLLN